MTAVSATDEPDAVEITPQVLLKAYTRGLFPMAESADDPTLYWIEPRERGVLPLEGIHVPRRLRRSIRQDRFRVCVDEDFEAVIDGCAGVGIDRPSTWINQPIRELYGALFELGFCHTVEVYDADELVGGLYGVSLGTAFFGESMFSRERDASKVALVHLAGRLCAGGYTLLDTQFVTDHLQQFGTVEMPRKQFLSEIEQAMAHEADFYALPAVASGRQILEALDVGVARRADGRNGGGRSQSGNRTDDAA